MEYVVTAEQMRMQERCVMERIGVPAEMLMERAALFAAGVIKKRAKKDVRILIACGTGNNGADGLALARILTEKGYRPEVMLLGEKERYSQLRGKQEDIFRKVSVPGNRIYDGLTDTKETGREYSVIVDAILGIGTSRELTGELKAAVEMLNQMRAYKMALDIPTGICADTGRVLGTAFRADTTVTFGLCKQGLLLGDGKICAGEILLDGCGMVYPQMEEKPTFVMDKRTVLSYLKRNPDGNKSTFGKLSFVSGCETIAGAAILNVCAAFRSGAGYVRLCTHENNREAVLSAAPETVLSLYAQDGADLITEKIKQAADFAHVICAGSGIGTMQTSKLLMEKLMDFLCSEPGKTWIFDADALNLLAKSNYLKGKTPAPCSEVILTPHVLEFSRMSGLSVDEIKADRVGAARNFAVKHGCIVVLKDAQTVVACSDGRVCISVKGNDGMAVAGSGDVLAGVIAGVAGQIKDPYMAACIGVYLHAAAGDMAAEKLGTHSMLPTDMIYYLKKYIKKLGKEAI